MDMILNLLILNIDIQKQIIQTKKDVSPTKKGWGMKIKCTICKRVLRKQGALFFSSPDKMARVVKTQMCLKCEGYFTCVLMKKQKETLNTDET